MAMAMCLTQRTCRLSTATRTGVFGARRASLQRTPLTISAKFKGYNCDFSKVPELQRHPQDCGSTEVQIAVLTARIQQITKHLEQHKKDFGTRRGMLLLLSQRKSLMQYLYKEDREKYDKLCSTLGLRNVPQGNKLR